MFRKSLIVFVISIFFFSAFALTETYAFRGHGSAGIKVYDADGQYLGLLDDSASHLGAWVRVFVPSLSLSGFISIDKQTGETPASVINHLMFQSEDCTGTPYIRPGSTYDIMRFGEKYYTGTRIAPIELVVRSTLESEESYRPGCNKRFYPNPVMVVPAEEVPADSLPFTLPVTLPLEFK